MKDDLNFSIFLYNFFYKASMYLLLSLTSHRDLYDDRLIDYVILEKCHLDNVEQGLLERITL